MVLAFSQIGVYIGLSNPSPKPQLRELGPRARCHHCQPQLALALKPGNYHRPCWVAIRSKGGEVPQVPTNGCLLRGGLGPGKAHQDSWAQASRKTSPTHWCAVTHGQRLTASSLCGVSVVGEGGARVYLYSPRTFRCLVSFRSPGSIIWNLREGRVTCGFYSVLRSDSPTG